MKNAVDDLKYNSLISVSIGIKGKVPPISWMYIPDEKTGLENRISFPSNFSPGTAPIGCSSILAEITYNEGDTVSRMSDQEVIDHIICSLTGMGLISPGSVISTGLFRHRFAYVVYDLHYLKNIAIVREYCNDIGIALVGRFSRFEYLNMDGCIRNVFDFVRGS